MTEPKEKELKEYPGCEIADEHSKVCHCQTESKDKQIEDLELRFQAARHSAFKILKEQGFVRSDIELWDNIERQISEEIKRLKK